MLQSLFRRNKMECPSCHGKMKGYKYRGIELDKCKDCNGIWFDKGEIEEYRLVRKRKKTPVEVTFQPILKDGAATARSCPRCKKQTLFAGRVRKAVAHRCANCEGFFIPFPKKVAPGTTWVDVGDAFEIFFPVLDIIGGVIDIVE